MGKSHDLATLKDDGGTFGSASDDVTFFGTSGTLLSTDTHISHNIYWGGSDWATIDSAVPSSSMRLGGGSDNEFRFMNAAAGSNSMTTRMTIDASGRVTMPYQLHIEGTPNRSGAGFANAFYTRNTPVGLSFSNERITVPIAGRYLVCWNTIADNGSGRVDTYLYINGVPIIHSMGESYNNAYRFRGAAHVFNLAANDYIQFYHQDFYNSGLSSWEQWNNASVTLLG